jgi:hypothetical protein
MVWSSALAPLCFKDSRLRLFQSVHAGRTQELEIQFREDFAAFRRFDRDADVRGRIDRQFRWKHPLKVITLPWLHVRYFTLPDADIEEVVHAIAGVVVLGSERSVRESDILRIDIDTDLFFGLSNQSLRWNFSGVDVAGRNLIIPILIVCIAPACDENLPVFTQEEVRSGYGIVAGCFGHDLFPLSRRSVHIVA